MLPLIVLVAVLVAAPPVLVGQVIRLGLQRRAFQLYLDENLTARAIQQRVNDEHGHRVISRNAVERVISGWLLHDDPYFHPPRKPRKYRAKYAQWIAEYWSRRPRLYRDEVARAFRKQWSFSIPVKKVGQLARSEGLTEKKLQRIARQRCVLTRTTGGFSPPPKHLR